MLMSSCPALREGTFVIFEGLVYELPAANQRVSDLVLKVTRIIGVVRWYPFLRSPLLLVFNQDFSSTILDKVWRPRSRPRPQKA